MTAEERELCRGLVVMPPRGARRISEQEFVGRFPSALENGRLACPLVEGAVKAQCAEDLQCALTVGFAFGFNPEDAGLPRPLLECDWHYSHEDVVSALEPWTASGTVEALFRATQWVPKSLEYDESRALAVKAICALGSIPGRQAEARLEELARSRNAVLKMAAGEQLQRRRDHGIPGVD